MTCMMLSIAALLKSNDTYLTIQKKYTVASNIVTIDWLVSQFVHTHMAVCSITVLANALRTSQSFALDNRIV